jgi:hypothetical protein
VQPFPVPYEIYATGNSKGSRSMSYINLVLEYLNYGFTQLLWLVGLLDPISALYGLLAGTYGAAARAVVRNDRHLLARCYAASALLHGLIGFCHFMQF